MSAPKPIYKLSPDYAEALAFAAYLHADQMRKLPADDMMSPRIPYVAHLLSVSALVLEHGGTEEEAIGALLHDAIEDQTMLHGGDVEAMRQRIIRRFGPKVLDIVEGCSDSHGVDRGPWEQRKRAYIEHLETASPSVLLVSAADKLHNARSILEDYRECGEEVWKRFNASPELILDYHRRLALAFNRAFARHGMNLLIVRKLESAVDELEQLRKNRHPS